MESQGVSSGSRRSAGGVDGRAERSSSSTQGVFLASEGDNKDGVAPKYRCGVYAILYMARTARNPNRLFFGCPFFKKASVAHCKYFVWLDRHIEKLGISGEQKRAEKSEDIDENFAMLGVENRITKLEDRLAVMERRNKPRSLLILGLLVWVVSLFAACM
ncbi:hypothetical protein PIB30_008688 [Stylosanthes scabra]|uniref:Zinc finger GRF-type domain-containing protein n=1 Tax=Stylosanthes scabra TaxID=79078 RepID=A0ABU6T6C1_9FABA|nr:hypothetical protein [Stylosanthes scabra]